MDYMTLTDEDKVQLVGRRIKELEAQHYDRSLTLHVVEASDQTPEITEAAETLRGEMATIESTVAKLRELLQAKEEVTEDSE